VNPMGEQVSREELERALQTQITDVEWEALEGSGKISEYTSNQHAYDSRDQFIKEIKATLDWIRSIIENTRREQSGEPLLKARIRDKVPEPADVTDVPMSLLSERTAARAQALIALDNYELGPTNPDRVRSRRISSRVRPQWGFDKTLPQWVIELEIEAWVPAEDVRSIYEHVQRDLLAEQASPKTQPHTFRVAQFVWEEELRCGARPSWRDLLERWKDRNPDDKGFSNRRAFRMCFKRGAEATRLRYKDSDEHIASEARRLKRLKEQWDDGPRFGLSPY
jgi:hypothetical protein